MGADGLERFTRQRATWKRSSIYYVLQAQKQYNSNHNNSINNSNNNNGSNNDNNRASSSFKRQQKHRRRLCREDYIRDVSIRCSNWAKETALKQGQKDYLSVHQQGHARGLDYYHDHDHNPLSVLSPLVSSSTLSSTRNKTTRYNQSITKRKIIMIDDDDDDDDKTERCKKQKIHLAK